VVSAPQVHVIVLDHRLLRRGDPLLRWTMYASEAQYYSITGDRVFYFSD
jgi:hypothetical protein